MTSPGVNFMVISEQRPDHQDVCTPGYELRPQADSITTISRKTAPGCPDRTAATPYGRYSLRSSQPLSEKPV